ncbi:RsmE family RNA methyltransferase [Aphanothece microscopica]|uniref:RsmE family RNA methyltransferase n=1 Tax=Aphanothece microscopica TaxID=1049561 RepID=UPI003984E039
MSLEAAERHYLRRVLRLRPGQAFGVVDGRGHLWSAQLAEGARADGAWAVLEQPLAEPLAREPAPWPCLGLAVAPPRRDTGVLLRMVCELGIDRLQWLQAERSVAAAEAIRADRQEAVLREALEQCERLWLPSCLAPEPACGWLAAAPGQGLALLATTRRPGLRSLGAVLQDWAGPTPPDSVTVAIGPEGGWSPSEERVAEAAGWRPVSLGEGILRSSTAAVAAATRLAAWREDLPVSCGTSPRPCP